MQAKQYICIEVQKGDHLFSFYMPSNVSWGNTIDAAYEVLQSVHNMHQQALEQLKPKEGDNNVSEK